MSARTTTRRNTRLGKKDWAAIVKAYELGLGNGAQLARKYRVSRQAISAGLKKRAAVKGRRIAETLAPLHKELDRMALERREERCARLRAGKLQMAQIDAMMQMLFAADREGNLASLGAEMRSLARAGFVAR